MRGLTHGALIADQLIDVVVRVDSIRQFAVNKMLLLLRDPHILSESTTDTSTQEVCGVVRVDLPWLTCFFRLLTGRQIPDIRVDRYLCRVRRRSGHTSLV